MATIHTSIVLGDNISSTLHNITSALNMTLATFQDLQNTASRDVDANAFNAIRDHINAATIAAQEFDRELSAAQRPRTVPVEAAWNTPRNIEIFDGGGAQRYGLEVQSATGMLNRMYAVQQEINQRASSMQILPASAGNDLNAMGARVQALRNQIERTQNARIQVVGAERANAEMQGLRDNLNQALITQEELNNALNEMDVSAASAAYNQLNSIVDSTERNIRDNVAEQQQFNNELRNGHSAAEGLQGQIMKMAAAYLSIRGAGEVLNLSDAMALNTARLDLIVDDGGSVQELQDKVFNMAQRSRSDYLAVSQTVSKLGLLAGDAFSSNDEMIAFTEQMNKNFIIGGSSIQEQSSAMYQLTQAMASGRLQGDEYRSVIENAPLLAHAIEDYMAAAGVEGTMKDWAAAGLLTSEVIKNALFSIADETNARFAEMPETFAQIAIRLKNDAIMAFAPILTRLNEMANSPAFQAFVNDARGALVLISGFVLEIFDAIAAMGAFVSDNWSFIGPIVYGAAAALAVYAGYLTITNGLELISKGLKIAVTFAAYAHYGALNAEKAATLDATAAQLGLNAALLACPLTWTINAIIIIVTVIYLVIAAINWLAGTSLSATGLIFGAVTTLGAFIWNLALGVLELILGVINTLVNPFITFANFLRNVFVNPVSSIIYLFQNMADIVLGILQAVASAIDSVFGSNLAGTLAGWRSGLKEMADAVVVKLAPDENYVKLADELSLSAGADAGLKRWEYADAFGVGYAVGESLENSILSFDLASFASPVADDYAGDYGSDYDPSSMARDVAGINSNTSDMKGIGEEDLKYLRDIAEREAINRFTTAEIKFDMGGVHNTVSSTMDLDGIADYIGDAMMERLEIVAEGAW
jgi:tape measure domain-containing protein